MIQDCKRDITTHMARIIQISRLLFLLKFSLHAPCQDIQAGIEHKIFGDVLSLVNPHEPVVIEDFDDLRQFAAEIE